jgi:pyruvate formate lyase activating enzyme
MTGTVFDIQKFALHDGPGIRTVVFLKGCSLKCSWCSNPESIQTKPQIGFMQRKCTNNGNCIPVCPSNAFSKGDSAVLLDFDKCISCGLCVDVCPSGALKMFGYSSSPEDLIENVIKDETYFKNSGGGLTLSGGEPLFKLNFALEILKLAKQRGLNTCIQTAGNIPQSSFEKILPYVDYYLFDYKITNSDMHKQHTGANNELILSNLAFLMQQNAQVFLRCPIVPGINNMKEHFEGIVHLSKKFPDLKSIELMAYHEYGADKYIQIGRTPSPINSGTVSKEQKEEWRSKLIQMGCENLI